MNYSEATLLQDLERLLPVYPPHMKKWVWEAEAGVIKRHEAFGDRTQVPPPPDDEGKFLFSLHLYCWAIYNRTNTDSGEQIIGREWDTDPYSLSTANISGRPSHTGYTRTGTKWSEVRGKWEKHTMWGAESAKDTPGAVPGLNYDKGAGGNVLKSDKWHPTMNDCWLLGGVHRQATFILVSPHIPENIWNPHGYPIVTAREILGLHHYGYTATQVKDKVVFKPGNKAQASKATICDYWNMIDSVVPEKSEATRFMRKLLDIFKNPYHAELRGFDKNKLNQVGR